MVGNVNAGQTGRCLNGFKMCILFHLWNTKWLSAILWLVGLKLSISAFIQKVVDTILDELLFMMDFVNMAHCVQYGSYAYKISNPHLT